MEDVAKMSNMETGKNENKEVVMAAAPLEPKEVDPLALCQLQILELQKQLETSRQEWNDLFDLTIGTVKNDDFARLLSKSDYSRWFRLLSAAAMKYLVVLTVRETPGIYMPDHVYKAILGAGFTKFKRDDGYTYVGVKYQGKTWWNEGKHHDEPASFTYESIDGSLSLQAYSESGSNGNRGEVYINDKQLAVNGRGVNVVVYDASKKKVIDSISFDCHVEGQALFKRGR